MYKLTLKLSDEWRNKVRELLKVYGVTNVSELFIKLTKKRGSEEILLKIDAIDKKLDSLINHIAWLEAKLSEFLRESELS